MKFLVGGELNRFGEKMSVLSSMPCNVIMEKTHGNRVLQRRLSSAPGRRRVAWHRDVCPNLQCAAQVSGTLLCVLSAAPFSSTRKKHATCKRVSDWA